MTEQTIRPGLGGVLILIAGLMALTTGIYSIQDPELMVDLYSEVRLSLTVDFVVNFGYVQAIFGIVAIIGGLSAMWGTRFWALAIVGGFLGFLGSGALFVGTILGLIGFILVLISKKEFIS